MSESLLSRLQAWARATGWDVVTEADEAGPGGTLALVADLDDDELALAVRVNDDGQRITAYSFLDDEVPAERRADVAEVVLRANRGLLTGAFELDLDNGDLRFRTNLDVGGAQLSDQQLDALMTPVLRDNVVAFATYLGAIEQVIEGSASPADAVREAEQEPEDDEATDGTGGNADDGAR
jgi:hypothetical protein